MKKLVIAATQAEVAGVFEYFKLDNINFQQTDQFDMLISGVGMTATAFALGKHLSEPHSLVINLGIAGTFTHRIPLSSLVNVVTDRFAELGAEDRDNFISIDELGFGKSLYSNRFPYQTVLVDQLTAAHGITVNKVHGNKDSIAQIRQRFDPDVESMEGAAVFYACEQHSIPCLQIRAISNLVEERNKATWQIVPAIRELNEWAIRFLTQP